MDQLWEKLKNETNVFTYDATNVDGLFKFLATVTRRFSEFLLDFYFTEYVLLILHRLIGVKDGCKD